MDPRLARGLVLAGAATLVLTACAQGTGGGAGGTGATPSSTYDPNAELTGSLSIMGFGADDDIAEARLEEAKSVIDPVDVTLIEGDLDIQQFLSAVAAGDPPEMIYANRDQIGTFASRGVIMPLDDCIAGEGVDIGMFREPAVAQVTFGDHVYGIPEFNQVQITMANQQLLDAAGLTIDDVNGSDWDAITAAAQTLVAGEGGSLSVIGYDSKLPEFLPLWAKSNGADLLSADGKTAQLNDPAVVEALEFAVGIYNEQSGFGTVKAYRDTADFFGAGNQFATNVLGAMPMEQWYVNVLNDVSPDAPMAFDAFRGKDGEPLAFSSGSAWAIPKDSANPVAACKFAVSMTAVDTWMKAAQARADAREAEGKPFTGLLTGNTEADDAVRGLVKPSGDEKWDAAVAATYEANDHTFSLPANPADAEFKTAWQDAVNRVLNGQQSPQDAMDQAQEEAQAALDAAWASAEQGG
jgi:multiple sugar transport system substrate-binding protein